MVFKKMQNLDTAFKQVRMFALLMIVMLMVLVMYIVYNAEHKIARAEERVYILANGKALEAFAADRRDNIPVEIRDHVRTFHYWFFKLDPDEKVINANMLKALYLADKTAKEQYDNLKENNYYSNLISGNISQDITVDSIQLDINQYPFYFKCFAVQKIIRPSTIATRNLITEGHIRNVSRSDNNPHGFLIERWRILENKDINIENR